MQTHADTRNVRHILVMWILVDVFFDLQVFLLPSPFVLLAQEARLEVAERKIASTHCIRYPIDLSDIQWCRAQHGNYSWCIGAEPQDLHPELQMSNQARIQKGLAVAVLSSSCTHLGTSESECSLSSEFLW